MCIRDRVYYVILYFGHLEGGTVAVIPAELAQLQCPLFTQCMAQCSYVVGHTLFSFLCRLCCLRPGRDNATDCHATSILHSGVRHFLLPTFIRHSGHRVRHSGIRHSGPLIRHSGVRHSGPYPRHTCKYAQFLVNRPSFLELHQVRLGSRSQKDNFCG